MVHLSEKPLVLQIGTHIRSTALWSCNPIVRHPADHTQYCEHVLSSLVLQPIGPMLKLRWCMSHQYSFPLVPKPYIWKVHGSAPQLVWHILRDELQSWSLLNETNIANFTLFVWRQICSFSDNDIQMYWKKEPFAQLFNCVFHHNWVYYTATLSA